MAEPSHPSCGDAGQGSERRCWGLARVKVKGPLKMVSADSVGEFEKGGWVIRLPQHMLGMRKAPGWGQVWYGPHPGRGGAQVVGAAAPLSKGW